MMKKTEKNNSAEDYLESILILHQKKGYARSIDIAGELGVTKPSVSNAMKRLREKGMIYINERGHIFFTDAGKEIAENIYRKHVLLTKVLMGIGVNENIASKEACSIEHVISDETYERLNVFFKTHLALAD